MGLDDKIKHQGEELAGKAKEGLGKATGDEDTEREGRAEQAEAGIKQAGDHVKDAAKDVKDAF